MTESKYSGIEWIGQIPSAWEVTRSKYCFCNHKIIVGGRHNSYERLALTMQGIIKRPKDDVEGLQPESFHTYQILKSGELVFKLIDLQNVHTSRVGLSPFTGIVSPAYIILSPNANIYPLFAEKYFISLWQRKIFNHLGDDGVRSSLSATDLLNVPFLCPSYVTQRAIATYIEEKCSDINLIIADIKSQIDVLEQDKRSTIINVTTRGVNSNVKTKESGISWLGSIPITWTISRGKYILSYMQKPVKSEDEVITCFRDGEVTLRSNRREEGFTFSDKEIGYQGIDVGDLVVHGMDGFAGAIGISDSRGKGSPVLNVLSTNQNTKFLMYYLRGMAYGNVFTSLATGIRVRSCDLRWNKLADLPYPIPPIEEQNVIATYLDDRCSEINSVIEDKKHQIEILNEYKKSLVYEYVTGKKEIGHE